MKLTVLERKLSVALAIPSLTTCCLWLARVVLTGSLRYGFINWNLILAWLPLLFSFGLVRILKKRPWKSWQALLTTALWFIFVPNSFYLVTDLMHLRTANNGYVLLDVVFLVLASICGLALGFSSMLLVQQSLNSRLRQRYVFVLVMAAILASSFAVYLGRYLRWNSWDVIFNPGGLLFDVSDRIISPLSHATTFGVTLLFAVFLTSLYAPVYMLVHAIKDKHFL